MFPGNRDLTVIRLHEVSMLMIQNAVQYLGTSFRLEFESEIKAAAPGCGYALECLAKLAFILDYYLSNQNVPSDIDIREFADGVYYLQGDARKSMRGHHVDIAIRGLVEHDADTFQELQTLLTQQFHAAVLRNVTAFHAFTRYAWVADLRGGDREVSFDASVFQMQQMHLAEQPPALRSVIFESQKHHEATFLPRVADSLADFALALSLGLHRIFTAAGDTALARIVMQKVVHVFPEQTQERTGASGQTEWDAQVSGSWGSYRF